MKALFSPEHGIRGVKDESVGDSVDEKTGLPVYSLYGERRKPTSEQLKDIDALVFDIQDVGCRFYTYTSTMGLTLEAAGEQGKKYFVLDRANPINGTAAKNRARPTQKDAPVPKIASQPVPVPGRFRGPITVAAMQAGTSAAAAG